MNATEQIKKEFIAMVQLEIKDEQIQKSINKNKLLFYNELINNISNTENAQALFYNFNLYKKQ